MDINDLLQGNLPDGLLDVLTSQIGAQNRQQTQTAASGVVNSIIGALNRNTNNSAGASALASALDRDHDGSILDDVVGMLSGQRQPQNSSMLNGAGILKHVLGARQGGVVDMISKMSGLNSNQSGSLLTTLAPLILGALGRQKKQQNMDAGGLSDFLTKTVQGHASKSAQMGLVEKLLDSDGDGSVMDDLAGIGMKMMGSFFRRRR
ncbi:MAG: DUF937 domain-containing protein [Bacteroidota bacterium]